MSDQLEEIVGTPAPPKVCKLAVMAFFCSVFITTAVGAFGLLLGLAAWWRMRSSQRPLAGWALVRLAVFLGGLSLFCQFYQFPLATLTPPIAHADHELRRHMEDLTQGRFSQAYNDDEWQLDPQVSHVMFVSWAQQLQQRYGHMQGFWVLSKTRMPHARTQYAAIFEKAGLVTLEVSEDDGRYRLERIDGQDVVFGLR